MPASRTFSVSSDNQTLIVPNGKIWAFDQGRRFPVSLAKAPAQGYTVVDFGDSWTPVLLTEHSASYSS